MQTKLSRWLSYIASCEYVFMLQLLLKFLMTYATVEAESYKNLWEHLAQTWGRSWLFFICEIILIVFSVVWNYQWKRMRNNTRIKHIPDAENTVDTIIASVSYLAMVITVNFDLIGVILSIATILILGIGIVNEKCAYFNLYLLVHGYHVFSKGNIRVITKKSMQEYRMIMEDTPDGIEARALSENVYIILQAR